MVIKIKRTKFQLQSQDSAIKLVWIENFEVATVSFNINNFCLYTTYDYLMYIVAVLTVANLWGGTTLSTLFINL